MNDTVMRSWKDIADYFGTSTRTVQRWESELGLPVRRLKRKRGSWVVAYKHELELWLARQAVAQPVAQLSDSHFRAMFHASKLPIDVIDDERRFVDANLAVLELLGRQRSEILGRKVDEFIDKPADEMEAEWQQFLKEGYFEGTVFVDPPAGGKVLVLYTVRRFLPGLNLAICRVIESEGDPLWHAAGEKMKKVQRPPGKRTA